MNWRHSNLFQKQTRKVKTKLDYDRDKTSVRFGEDPAGKPKHPAQSKKKFCCALTGVT